MLVVVASNNPVKLAAVRQAFSAQFGGDEIRIEPVEVDSGVDNQPKCDAETRTGARNPAVPAAENYPG